MTTPTKIIDVDAEEETSRPAFNGGNVHSDHFVCVAWFLSNFGIVAPHVWWGYKIGYYLVAFPILLGIAATVDCCIVAVRLSAYIVRRATDVAWHGLQSAAKILVIAAALMLVAMYIYNNGIDGMAEDYKKMCEWLKCFVSQQ